MFKLALVGDTTFHYKSLERFANSKDSRDYELINEKKVCNLFKLARVGDTTFHYKSLERFANSKDSRIVETV